MKVTPELIAAIASWLDANDNFVDTSSVYDADYCVFLAVKDAAVQSLLAALAKCEPVRGLVDAATEAQGELEALGCACQPQADGETDLGPCAMCLLGPALAPFTEGGE